MPPNPTKIEKALETLKKDFVVVGKTRVRSWHAWLIIGLCVGIVVGIVFVANRSGEFEASRAAQICEVYSYEVPVECSYYDDIFGNYDCWATGPVSGCDYDEEFEPYYCWINEQYCYDDGTTTTPPPTATIPEVADPNVDISLAVYDEAIGVEKLEDVFIGYDPKVEWPEFYPEFINAASEAAQPFCGDCTSLEESLIDLVQNHQDEGILAEWQGEVTELTAGCSGLECAALGLATQLSDDTEAIIDDARGYTDAEYEEMQNNPNDDIVPMDATLDNKIDKLNCSPANLSPNIPILNCGLPASELLNWQFYILTARSKFAPYVQSLIDKGSVPIILFKDRASLRSFLGAPAFPGYALTIMDFGAEEEVTVIICSECVTDLLFEPLIMKYFWNTAIFAILHEITHVAIYFRTGDQFGGPLGIQIASDGSRLNGCLTRYACTSPAEYFAETVAIYMLSGGKIVPPDVGRTIDFLQGYGIIPSTILLTSLPHTSIQLQSDLQLDITSYNSGFNFKNLLAGLFSLIPETAGAVTTAVSVNETQIAFDKLQKMSDTLANISNQAGQVAETQVITAISAIVPGVDQWLDLDVPDKGVHRYWRFLDQGSLKKMQISEIAMSEYSIANLTPLTGIPIYFAPGKLPGAAAIAKAFDKNTQNLVTLTPSIGATYIGLDFGTPKNIRGVSLYNHLNTSTFKAKLQYSDDKTNWIDAGVSANIPVATKNTANILFASNVAPEAAKIKMRGYGFSKLTPVYGETRDAFTTGKAIDGKSAMTKDFEALLKGALNAGDARNESGFANNTTDTTTLPFTNLTLGLQNAAKAISKHASLASAIVEQNVLTSAVAGSKAKQMPEFKVAKDDTASIAASAEPMWTDAKNALTNATAGNNEIKSILKTAPSALKAQIQVIADDTANNLKNTTSKKQLASRYINLVRGNKTAANNYYNTVVSLNSSISTQAKSVSVKSQTMMNREEVFLNAANNQFIAAMNNANNAVKNTSASTQRSLILKAATQVKDTARRLNGGFTSKSETLYIQYYNLAAASSNLAAVKTALKTSLDAWKLGVDLVKAKGLKTTAEVNLELLRQATQDAKMYAQKVQDNLNAAKALIGTP